MHNYSLNNDVSKKYILSYNIENEKIVAKLGSGELYIIPYSEENEKKIIERMEEQARYATVKPIKKIDKVLAVTQPLVLPLAIGNFVNQSGLIWAIVLGVIGGGAIGYPLKLAIHQIRKKDIEKLKYFLDNKEEFNKYIEKSDNMFIGMSKSAFDEIELQKSRNKEPFNINNIDKYSLRELKALKQNIERFQSFGFDEETTVFSDVDKVTQSQFKKEKK